MKKIIDMFNNKDFDVHEQDDFIDKCANEDKDEEP